MLAQFIAMFILWNVTETISMWSHMKNIKVLSPQSVIVQDSMFILIGALFLGVIFASLIKFPKEKAPLP